MLQVNLLPNVKLQYIKARQRKRLVVGTSLVVSIFFVSIFIILFSYVRFAQKQHLSHLDKDISRSVKELKEKKEIEKILTVQNQLNSLPNLHSEKVISSRLFDFLTQLTPAQATISEVNIDFAANSLVIKGNADELGTVNKFADTLKFTEFESSGEDPKKAKAFSEVVLDNFSLGVLTPGQTNKVSYELKVKYDPIIFSNINTLDGQQAVTLKVPNIISTRSDTERPKDLFAPQPQPANIFGGEQ